MLLRFACSLGHFVRVTILLKKAFHKVRGIVPRALPPAAEWWFLSVAILRGPEVPFEYSVTWQNFTVNNKAHLLSADWTNTSEESCCRSL